MDEPSLQTTLRKKYNITDRLLAEGRFVGLIGDHATSFVCLGLGIRCLVIARVVLSGDVIDYDLLSLIPLQILSLSYQNVAKKIKIRSQFKATQVYQMCTSTNQAEVWDNFTSTIREVYMPERGDIWCNLTLQPPKRNEVSPRSLSKEFDKRSSVSSDNAYSSKHDLNFPQKFQSPKNSVSFSRTSSVDFEQPSVDFSKYDSISAMSHGFDLPFLKLGPKLSESSESLPPKLPSQAANNSWLKDPRKNQSMLNLDIKFESFVNDSPTLPSEDREISVMGLSTFSADKLNISNNFIDIRDTSNTTLSDTSETSEESSGRLNRFFRRVFSCCSEKSRRSMR
ncbi:uncharacterized protein LOC123562594 [Mercenaria mercenaria]|uniref:uncharacterized protein LOC123562594 n=1 Tax=Mercenaria mercenaria TaxID=6596 RepID=UPI00234F53CC|nr:uncharacterized protein LOC123562594 [Mercenaria mercenaria]